MVSFMSLLVNSVPGVCCVIMSLLPCVFKFCLLSSMSSGLLVIPGVSVCLHCPCLPLMSSLKTIILNNVSSSACSSFLPAVCTVTEDQT